MTYVNGLMAIVGGSLVVLLVAAMSQRYELLPWKAAVGLFSLALLVAFIGGCITAVLCFKSLSSDSQNNTLLLVLSFLGLTPLVTLMVIIGPKSFALPKIHNISTDLASPPEFIHAPSLRKPSDNSLAVPSKAVRQQQAAAYSDIQTFNSALSVEAALERSLSIAEQLGWQVTYQDKEQALFEAVVATALLGFKDDVVVRVQSSGEGSRIDLRSVSRVGVSDLGANAARIRRFLALFADNQS